MTQKGEYIAWLGAAAFLLLLVIWMPT